MTPAAETARAAFRKISEALDDARHDYASAHGEDYGQPDYANANEYRDEGFLIGEAAFDMPEEDREDYIDGQFAAYPTTARFLVWCAADYRLFEMVREDDRFPFRADALEMGAPA